ncbi:MAG: hypothetical protein P8168_03140 [Deltaproteobacteria bacterium]|jgi:peptidoglycan hydrolase CwlO-like protein
MKKLAAIISMLALVMLVGCGKAETPQQTYQKKATAKIEDMQKKINKLTEEYSAKVAEMHKKFNEKMATGKKSYDETVAGLKQQQAAAKKELAAMKSATGDAWEKAKAKMDKMMEGMEKTYEKVKSELK